MIREKRFGRLCATFLITGFLLVLACYWAIGVGGIDVTKSELFRGLFFEYNRDVAIIIQLRFPRIIVAILGGAMMAMAGVMMQAVMRNPLADPGIIGINSGAATAAVLVMALAPEIAGFTPVFAFLGGMLAFGMVFLMSHGSEMNPVRLILTGVAVNAFFTGIYEAFQAATGSSYTGAQNIVEANISLESWSDVKYILVYFLISLILAVGVIPFCNLLGFSDQTLGNLGIHVGRVRMMVSIVAVFMAAVFTAMVGAVSFLGLIVPHVARMLVGSNHKVVLPYSALLGSLILLVADTVGRALFYPYEISAAILMSILGGPLLMILLRRSGKINGM